MTTTWLPLSGPDGVPFSVAVSNRLVLARLSLDAFARLCRGFLITNLPDGARIAAVSFDPSVGLLLFLDGDAFAPLAPGATELPSIDLEVGGADS